MRLIIASVCVLVLSQGALAQFSSHTFEVGTQLFNYDYQEVWPPPKQSHESGFIPGLSLGYTYRGLRIPIYARGSFEYTSSQTTYDGDILFANGGFAPYQAKTNNHFLRLDVQAGYSFRFGRQFAITPYTGYGYRSWVRLLSGQAGYEEDYHWSYLPIGVRGDYLLGTRFSLGLDASVRLMFGGGLDIQGVYDNPALDLGSKVGFRLSLPSAVKLTRHWDLGFDPWMEFSGISESNHHLVAGPGNITIFEPESNTSIFGTTFTVQYGF